MCLRSVPVDKLADILASSENFLQRMHQLGQEPASQKQLQRLFLPSEAAEMVGCDRTTLARAESAIGLESAPRTPGSNRRVGYTLEQVQAFRQYYDKLPWRNPRRTSRSSWPARISRAVWASRRLA